LGPTRCLDKGKKGDYKYILEFLLRQRLKLYKKEKIKSQLDIESKRMLIHIREAKARKDRYTMLLETALETIRQYWREYKPTKWFFDGARDGRYLSTKTVEKFWSMLVGRLI